MLRSYSRIALVVLVLAGALYLGVAWFLGSGERLAEVNTNGKDEPCALQMPVMARNDAQEVATFATPCDVPEGWRALSHENSVLTKDGSGNTFEQYRDETLGFHFAHRVDPNPTVVVPLPLVEEEGVQVVESILMLSKEEYELFTQSTEPREGPPMVSLRVYAGVAASLEAWVEMYPQLSLTRLRTGEIEQVEVGGVKALRYIADGLYQNDVLILAHEGNTFVFIGSFANPEDLIRKDFLTLIESLTFL